MSDIHGRRSRWEERSHEGNGGDLNGRKHSWYRDFERKHVIRTEHIGTSRES
jgi:hypothetical protein